MRKLFFVILAIGAGAWLLVAATAKGGWGAGVVMMGMGLLVAAPVWLWARKDTLSFSAVVRTILPEELQVKPE